MAQFVKVARTADLAADEAKRVEVAGRRSPSSTQRGSFYVIDDTRTHRGGPLS
jgi:nitrite reductase/ring-hydroxylating ferredoxin subunit